MAARTWLDNLDMANLPPTWLDQYFQARDPLGFDVVRVVIDAASVTLSLEQFNALTIVAVGALSQNAALILPTGLYQKMIHNATSGAFTLTCKSRNGTGGIVPQGAIRWIYCDGTNIVSGT